MSEYVPKIVNFGSINVDHVYQVDHFVKPGETLACQDYRKFAGGKGLNQSLALAHAGAEVCHVGRVGKSDIWLRELLGNNGVDISLLDVVDSPSGHGIIQVTPEGENAIVIHGGANQCITRDQVEESLNHFNEKDFLLVQNEVSSISDILQLGKKRGLSVFFAPAPMTKAVFDFPLHFVDMFMVNEIEAHNLTGKSGLEAILEETDNRFPHATFVITLGEKGAIFKDDDRIIHQAAERVNPVDTTAAGDTFTGFFLAEWIRNKNPETALKLACKAAAICVTRAGAATSIPLIDEIDI